MNVAESFRSRLHRMKNRIQYRNAKIRLERHLKKTPGLSAVPVNHFPSTLRGDFNYDYYTVDILKSADNIQHDFTDFRSSNCSCSCHSSPLPQTPLFHGVKCLKNCGQTNKEYKCYLTHKIRTVGT